MGSYGDIPKDYDLHVSAQLNARDTVDRTRRSKHSIGVEGEVSPTTDPVYDFHPAPERPGPTAAQLTAAAIAVDRAFGDQVLEAAEHLDDRKRHGL